MNQQQGRRPQGPGGGQYTGHDRGAPQVTLGARDRVEDARALAETLIAEHGLDGWRVRIDNAKRRLGGCHFRQKTIGLSRQYIAVEKDDVIRDTILHEIAHALAGPDEGHGPVWKETAARIGATPKRCADAEGMKDARARRLEDAIAASAASRRYTWRDRIEPGTEVVVIEGQQYLRGMRATILKRLTSRYLVETEDGQQFRAGPEFFGRVPDEEDALAS